eukprot:COSAG01_NODE_2636_length_7330_cov_3.975384_2_plen_96_part_00
MRQELVGAVGRGSAAAAAPGDEQWSEAGDAQAAEKVATSYLAAVHEPRMRGGARGDGGRLPLWLFVAPWCAGTAGRAVRLSEVGLYGGERGDGGA